MESRQKRIPKEFEELAKLREEENQQRREKVNYKINNNNRNG